MGDNCRKCGKGGETIQHVLNGCEALVTREYKERHDMVGKILHQEIIKCIIEKTKTVPYCQYQPELIVQTERYTIYWDRTIRTDREAIHNRTDIVIYDRRKKKVQSQEATT